MNKEPGFETLARAANAAALLGEERWMFDGFTLDARRGELRSKHGPIALRPKTYYVLLHLIRNAGRVIGKDEMFEVLWPARVVLEDSLVQCIGELRAALGDRDQQSIRTVRGLGYRFDALVTDSRKIVCDSFARDRNAGYHGFTRSQPWPPPRGFFPEITMSQTPAVLEKRLYTAVATATSGREGRARSDDGLLDVGLVPPKALGGSGVGGTNPEQLFAAGYAACFGGAFGHVARAQKITTGPVSITSSVTIGPVGQAFGLAVDIAVSAPELSREQAQALLEAAHQVCPYSNATRGNIEVNVHLA